MGWPKGLQPLYEDSPKEEVRVEGLESSLAEYDLVGSDDLDVFDISIPRSRFAPNVRQVSPKVANCYLPFIAHGVCQEGRDWTLVASPQLLFRPEALMMWGFNDESVITNILIGHQIQGAVAYGEVPCSFWGTAKSYEKLMEDFRTNGISPPSWITFKTAEIGNNVSLSGRGKLTHAIMLGKAAF